MLNYFQQMDLIINRRFSQSLNSEEKIILKEYLNKLPRFRGDDEERRKYNLMGMAFIEGYRVRICEEEKISQTNLD